MCRVATWLTRQLVGRAEGLLADCEFCRRVRREVDELRYSAHRGLDALGVPFEQTRARMYPLTPAQRAAYAHTVLPDMEVEWREVQWHEQRMQAEARRAEAREREAREQRGMFMQRAEPPSSPQREQQQVSPPQPPDPWVGWQRRAPAALQDTLARLWLLEAALGDHCRHCVDPGCGDCPVCASPLDSDPGEAGPVCCRCVCVCRWGWRNSFSQRHAGLPTPAVGNNTLATHMPSRLLGLRHSEAVRVYERRCLNPACGYAAGYDGASSGVANWSNETLYCEELLRDYWNTFFTQKQKTVHAYWTHIGQTYEFVGSGQRAFVSRKSFT